MAANRPKAKVREKVVWQEKAAGPAQEKASCPVCGATGSTVDRSATTAYFVCPTCQRTWQLDLRGPTQSG